MYVTPLVSFQKINQLNQLIYAYSRKEPITSQNKIRTQKPNQKQEFKQQSTILIGTG